MREQGGGSIVNIGTMAAYSGGANICAYGSSKAALLNLTKSMAMDWAQWNVRVNMLSPGPFMSEMMEGGAKTQPGFLDLVAGGTFLKRIADPAGDRRAGLLPRERRVVVRDRRRPVGLRRDDEVSDRTRTRRRRRRALRTRRRLARRVSRR